MGANGGPGCPRLIEGSTVCSDRVDAGKTAGRELRTLRFSAAFKNHFQLPVSQPERQITDATFSIRKMVLVKRPTNLLLVAALAVATNPKLRSRDFNSAGSLPKSPNSAAFSVQSDTTV